MAKNCLENNKDVENWNSTITCKLSIGEQIFFNNANIILNQNPKFKNKLGHILSGDIDIKTTIRSEKINLNIKSITKV